MTYSLISPSALGFDLVRHPSGRQIAEVLLSAMNADSHLLHDLASAHPRVGLTTPARRTRAVQARRARETARRAVPQLRDLAAHLTGLPATGIQELLVQGAIGNSADVERFLREDILSSGHPAAQHVPAQVRADAADVLAEAVIAHWGQRTLAIADVHALTAAWHSTKPPAQAGPAIPTSITGVWAALTDDGSGTAQLCSHRAHTGTLAWATAMHEAAWVAHLADRARTLTAAHLECVLAFLDAGLTATDAAVGAWSALSGRVYAAVTADVLSLAAFTVLNPHTTTAATTKDEPTQPPHPDHQTPPRAPHAYPPSHPTVGPRTLRSGVVS